MPVRSPPIGPRGQARLKLAVKPLTIWMPFRVAPLQVGVGCVLLPQAASCPDESPRETAGATPAVELSRPRCRPQVPLPFLCRPCSSTVVGPSNLTQTAEGFRGRPRRRARTRRFYRTPAQNALRGGAGAPRPLPTSMPVDSARNRSASADSSQDRPGAQPEPTGTSVVQDPVITQFVGRPPPHAHHPKGAAGRRLRARAARVRQPR
jgi:hypothetical protein